MNPKINLIPGFDAGNAKVCAWYSRDAYIVAGDVTGFNNTSVIVRDCGNALVVAFQGTHTAAQFITDCEITWSKALADCHIHFGFYAAFANVRPRLQEVMESLGWSPDKPAVFTGHSLGGALAMLAAYIFSGIKPVGHVHSVYTFGQPRVGDARFAKLYGGIAYGKPSDGALDAHTFRFVNELDIVPRVPGWLIGYRHAGQCCFFTVDGRMVLNPPWWKKAVTDARVLYRAWTQKQEVLLADHHMDLYLQKVNQLA